MISRCHILEVCPQRGPGRYVHNKNLEDMFSTRTWKICPKAWKKLASSGISSHYLTLTGPIHLHIEVYVPIPCAPNCAISLQWVNCYTDTVPTRQLAAVPPSVAEVPTPYRIRAETLMGSSELSGPIRLSTHNY